MLRSLDIIDLTRAWGGYPKIESLDSMRTRLCGLLTAKKALYPDHVELKDHAKWAEWDCPRLTGRDWL